MALSLRDVAQRCLDVTGRISVNDDVYGYIFRDTDGSMFGSLQTGDTLPGTNSATGRSLRRFLQTINGRAFDLVVFLVGHENDFTGFFTRDNATTVQYAIQVARDIYAQQNLGIRRIDWRRIPRADVGNYLNIDNRAEAENLTDDFSGPPGGIDVFFVQTITGAGGWSNVDGPCNKNSSDDLTGAVLEVSGSRRFTGVLLGHELGHYLGLDTGTSPTNVMGVDQVPPGGDGIDELTDQSTGLTAAQGTAMRGHCSVSVASPLA